MNPMILGILRHALTTLGGGLAMNGTLSGDDLNTAIGCITTLIGIAWSVYDKRQRTAW